MWQSVSLSWNIAVQILVVFSPLLVADTKIIFSYNFVALLTDFFVWQGSEYAYESKSLYSSKCFGNLSDNRTI